MNPDSLRTGFQVLFLGAYNSAKPMWSMLATKVTSSGSEEEYGWLGNVPGMREMNGERMPKGLTTYDFTIKNKEFESTVEIRKSDIDDNKIASKNVLFETMGNRAALFPDELIFTLIKANGLAYDGQNYFDTDHSEGLSGTQSNDLTGTGYDEASVSAAITALKSFKDDQGEIMYPSVTDILIVTLPSAELTVRKLFTSTLSTGGENELASMVNATVISSARLTTAKQFYVFNVSGGLMPFIYQEREFIPMEYDGGSADGSGSHEMFMRKRFYFGPYLRGNVGYADWRKAVRVTFP